MCSEHKVVQNKFKITTDHFKVTEKIVTHINWNLIVYYKMINEIYFTIAYLCLYTVSLPKTKFYKYILQAGAATATTNNQKNKD